MAAAQHYMEVFQSTLPVRGGTLRLAKYDGWDGISIHPPRAGRDAGASHDIGGEGISIHPPRAGRDTPPKSTRRHGQHFNPPSPCGEGRERYVGDGSACNFNPPSPCGEGQSPPSFMHGTTVFQSTLPVRGGTTSGFCADKSPLIFQSTLPVRGGTPIGAVFPAWLSDFNPPSPCGEGPMVTDKGLLLCVFQSTLPVRGGTLSIYLLQKSRSISIHPPRAGRDLWAYLFLTLSPNFNPPSPCGEGRHRKSMSNSNSNFNPPSPCGEGRRFPGLQA